MRSFFAALLGICLLAGPMAAQDPTAAGGGLADADRFFRAGKLDDALRLYRATAQHEPASPAAQFGVARCLFDLDNVSEADSSAAELVSRFPQFAPGHALLANVRFREGRFAEAEGGYRKALDIDPRLASAWLGWARLARIVSKRKTARRLVEQAYRVDPKDPEVLLAWAQYQRTEAERLALLRQYLALDTSAGEQSDRIRKRVEAYAPLGDRKFFALASPYAKAALPLEILMNGPTQLTGYAVRVSINGAKPENMLLDTGAFGVTVSSRAAERAGLKQIAATQIAGFGDQGPMSGYTAFADRITIGGLEFHDCIVDVSDKKMVGEAVGIIGADVFRDFIVTIDFFRRELRLRPYLSGPADDFYDRAIAEENKSFEPFFRVGHMILVRGSINDGEPGLFLVDTGANFTSVSSSFAQRSTKVGGGNDRMTVKGLSGKVKNVYTANRVDLKFAGFRQKGYDITAMDYSAISRSAGTEVAGVFGLPLLNLFTLTIDYRNGLIDFQYVPPPPSR